MVEISRDPRGRLSTQGQVWHTDLDHVRRFGHALGSNSRAERVQITDNRGEVVEQIPVCADPSQAAGWTGWRDRPLPPLPPRPKARRAAPPPLRRPPPSLLMDEALAAASAGPPQSGPAPRDLPVVEQIDFDPESTVTLAPAPPP